MDNTTGYTEDELTKMWESVDFAAAEEKLLALQRSLTFAVFNHADEDIKKLQKRIVRDIDIKCLAVRQVARSTSSPGIDGIKWMTPAEKMQAALALGSKNYKASPMRQFVIKDKFTLKERYIAVPTYFDRAMQVLYGYSFVPVVEAVDDKRSFAFRQGRSAADAHEYIMDALKGEYAPEFVICTDVKGYYEHIQHEWLLAHAPMDKKVLRAFLKAGIVFNGELFPAEDSGVSLGANIAPYIGNFVLSGLQKSLYIGIHGRSEDIDYDNGRMVRYADDIFIAVRTKDATQAALSALEKFLGERGLKIAQSKTTVNHISDGFTFLSRTYKQKNGWVIAQPSESAINKCISECASLIGHHQKSQRALIDALNQKLRAWAQYHRITDAAEAFQKVDNAVQALLMKALQDKHPRSSLEKLKAKYWYEEADGTHSFALPDDKSIKVIKLQDINLIRHKMVDMHMNPFLDKTFLEHKKAMRPIKNVTGPFVAVWKKQGGKCYYCGRPILDDQPRFIVQRDINRPLTAKNAAYVHSCCQKNEFQIIRADDNINTLTPLDIEELLQGIINKPKAKGRKQPIKPTWQHYKLKMFFAKSTVSTINLTIKQIEEIEGRVLPASARRYPAYWCARDNHNTIAEAWQTECYALETLNLQDETLVFKRTDDGLERLKIPPELLGKLPEDAVFELEQHFDYIIKKYALKR